MQVLLPMWLGANGVDVKDVIMMQLDSAVVIASLLEGQIDAGECWRANSIPLVRKARQRSRRRDRMDRVWRVRSRHLRQRGW